MSKYLDAATNWLGNLSSESWQFIDALDRQEWLILLVVATSIGFFCMRGYGSNKGY
jgi:hypothetical protein